MRAWSNTRRAAVIGLVLGLACPAMPGRAADQQGVSGKVVTIGGNAIMSGASLAGQANTAAQVYFDMVNREGGVNGYTFKYIARDNALQPAQGVAIAQQLVRSDSVFAMIVVGSAVIQALMPIAPILKLPIFTFGDSDLLRPLVPNAFGVNPRYSRLPLFEAQFALKTLGIKNLAYIYEDTAIGRPGLKTMPDFVAANGGQLMASIPFSTDTTDWAPYVGRAKESGAKAIIFFAGGASPLPGFQKAAEAIGYRPTYVAIYANLIPAYLKLAGPLAEGTYIDSVSEPIDSGSPAATRFIAELKRANADSAIGAFGGQGWTGAAIIVEGVRRSTKDGAPLTWESFQKALETINGEPVGMFPSVTYTKDDHTGATKAAMFQVRNGAFVQVLPVSDIP